MAALVTNPYAKATVFLVAIAIVLAGVLRDPARPRGRNLFAPAALLLSGLGWLLFLATEHVDLPLTAPGLVVAGLLAPATGIVGVLAVPWTGGKWLAIAGLEAGLSFPAIALAALSACGDGCFG